MQFCGACQRSVDLFESCVFMCLYVIVHSRVRIQKCVSLDVEQNAVKSHSHFSLEFQT